MLAMYSNLSCDNWAELLPFVQLAHNTAYSTTLQETPHFLMCITWFSQSRTAPKIDMTLLSRSIESAVERHAKGRTPWAAITVTLFQLPSDANKIRSQNRRWVVIPLISA